VRSIKKVVGLLIFAIFLPLLLSGCFEPPQYYDAGDDFVFTMLDGSEKHLSDYRGKVVILDMWATWCGPCIFQMTELAKIYENYSRNELEILSVDIDSRETVQVILEFINEFEFLYNIDLTWVFGLDTNGSIWEKYVLEDGGIPTIYIFDQNGNVHFSHEGITVFTEIPEGWPSYQAPPPILYSYIEELLD
jgi:thiol-disulfide isomerase/thioredoxin